MSENSDIQSQIKAIASTILRSKEKFVILESKFHKILAHIIKEIENRNKSKYSLVRVFSMYEFIAQLSKKEILDLSLDDEEDKQKFIQEFEGDFIQTYCEYMGYTDSVGYEDIKIKFNDIESNLSLFNGILSTEVINKLIEDENDENAEYKYWTEHKIKLYRYKQCPEYDHFKTAYVFVNKKVID